ncbi:WecB/TagA/CpsF family glycosyltransferase [Paraburkholderia agricolaris]|uniref:WecB/TagA/CpsF family glycosyltransferase n=1 Tax=Paraburkholderia agricolaris TaxID=2152888 RepID=A0ABW8ZQJ1_9BURK
MTKFSIFGLEIIASASPEELASQLINANSRYAVSLNPEIISAAFQNSEYRHTIERADNIFADGAGIVWAVRRKYSARIARVPGCEVWEELMRIAYQKSLPVYLIGSSSSTVAATVNKLRENIGTPICGFRDGYFAESELDPICQEIAKLAPRIVTVALGSPRQDFFIEHCRQTHPECLYLGVGGTFDAYTGHVKRAPEIWQKLNLEWLFRVVMQPSRIKRQGARLRFAVAVLTGLF